MIANFIETKSDEEKNVCLPCVHCGEPTLACTDTSPQGVFCCAGCRGAHELIQGWNLDQFYDLRDQTGNQSQPASPASPSCEIFDHPELLRVSRPRELGQGLWESTVALQGLHCRACAWLIENAAKRTPGWVSARVNMNEHTLQLIYREEETSLGRIARLLARLGYQPFPLSESNESPIARENRRLLSQIAIAGFCAANTMWIAIALYAAEAQGVATAHFHFLRWISAALGFFAVAGPGRTFFQGALASIRTRTPHMDLPVGLGLLIGTLVGLTNTALGTGAIYFDSLAVLVFLLLIGRWIQFRQQHRAAKAVDLMMRITPHHAKRIQQDGATQLVDVQSLVPGELVRVAAGESVPVDGTIEKGSTSIDRSLLTGESRPEITTSGDEVCAGTLNIQRTIDVRVTATGQDSRVGRVMKLVESASRDKPPIVQFADRIGGVFVLVVTSLATFTFVYWLSAGWQTAAANATSLLIVACPCALALATPLAIAVALGRSARNRIFVRDGGLLQRLASARGTVWFDKTGTLTEGRPRVTGTFSTEIDRAITYAAAVESGCSHPIATGILEEAKRRGLKLPKIDSPTEMRQGGVLGEVLGHDVGVGNLGLIRDINATVSSEQLEKITEILESDQSPILVSIDSQVVCIFAISDPLRADAKHVVEVIKASGWDVGILSGDNPRVVSSVARDLGIKTAEAGLTPEAKLATIQDSRKSGRSAVMIGDGANDAAALAAADVGIALRGGAEASLQAAPVYVASGHLSGILDLLKIATSTRRLIHVTFAVSLSYNAIAVALATTGTISPLIAAVLMPISSVSVLVITMAWPILKEPTS